MFYYICGENIFPAKYLRFYTSQKKSYLIWTKNEHKLSNYFQKKFQLPIAMDGCIVQCRVKISFTSFSMYPWSSRVTCRKVSPDDDYDDNFADPDDIQDCGNYDDDFSHLLFDQLGHTSNNPATYLAKPEGDHKSESFKECSQQ